MLASASSNRLPALTISNFENTASRLRALTQPPLDAPPAEIIVAPPTTVPPSEFVSSKLLPAALAACLAFVLLLQAVHHWRNELSLLPGWHAPIAKLYSVLQLPLTPNWSLRDYDLKQLGTAAYGGSDQTLWIKLQLANGADAGRPWPRLRLSLNDRFGKTLSSRLLEPRDYLRDGRTPDSPMPIGHSLQSEIGVIKPPPEATGFELDVCLPSADGVRCASDEVMQLAQHR
jgi:hypothetical protein